jgi:hypothetical protein
MLQMYDMTKKVRRSLHTADAETVTVDGWTWIKNEI